MHVFRLGIFALALAGCATGYKPEGFGGGYSDAKYGPNIFSVTVRGNGVTSFDRATELAMLRSAEITLKNGFTHFIIADQAQESKTGTFVTPSSTRTTGTVSAYGNTAYLNANSTTTGGQIVSVSKPRVSFKIETFQGAPDRSLGLAYDASALCASLGPKYDMSCPEVAQPVPPPRSTQTAAPSPNTHTSGAPQAYASSALGSFPDVPELKLMDGWTRKELTPRMTEIGWQLHAGHKKADAAALFRLFPRGSAADGAALANTLRSNQINSLEKTGWSEIEESTLNGRKVWRFSVNGNIKNGMRITYLGTVVEGISNYAFINAWTGTAQYETNKAVLETLATGLKDF